jgi:hypothetical protein
MKTFTKTFRATSLLLFLLSCNKENINGPAFIQSSSVNNTVTTALHYIGEQFGGGIIFWLDSTGRHGLICDSVDFILPWSNGSKIKTGATGTSIGTGMSNTKRIIKVQGDSGIYAAKICRDYRGGGYSDWYLPSINELKILRTRRFLLGGAALYEPYWSSTEYNTASAWFENFLDGNESYNRKKNGLYVRAIRSFKM